jgi:phosphatidate cytidylyltransferase
MFGGAAWWAPPLVLLIVAGAVAVLAVLEFCALTSRLGAPVAKLPAAVSAVAVCTAVVLPPVAAIPVIMAVVLAAGAGAVGRGRTDPESLSSAAAGVLGPLYVGLPLGAMMAIRVDQGRELLALLVFIVVASDTAQYYTGRAFGRHPLAPALSPKKTVEGAIGGLLAGSLALAVIGHWWWPEAPVGLRVTLGAVLVALGITGDLFESMLKRAAGVKDSAALIPGHGGVLDRIDALLFAAPVYYTVVRYVARVA